MMSSRTCCERNPDPRSQNGRFANRRHLRDTSRLEGPVGCDHCQAITPIVRGMPAFCVLALGAMHFDLVQGRENELRDGLCLFFDGPGVVPDDLVEALGLSYPRRFALFDFPRLRVVRLDVGDPQRSSARERPGVGVEVDPGDHVGGRDAPADPGVLPPSFRWRGR